MTSVAAPVVMSQVGLRLYRPVKEKVWFRELSAEFVLSRKYEGVYVPEKPDLGRVLLQVSVALPPHEISYPPGVLANEFEP